MPKESELSLDLEMLKEEILLISRIFHFSTADERTGPISIKAEKIEEMLWLLGEAKGQGWDKKTLVSLFPRIFGSGSAFGSGPISLEQAAKVFEEAAEILRTNSRVNEVAMNYLSSPDMYDSPVEPGRMQAARKWFNSLNEEPAVALAQHLKDTFDKIIAVCKEKPALTWGEKQPKGIPLKGSGFSLENN